MSITSNEFPPITLEMVLKALENSLMVFSAVCIYVINLYLRYDIMNYHPILKKYYIPIAIFMQLFIFFILDFSLIYSFYYFFDVMIWVVYTRDKIKNMYNYFLFCFYFVLLFVCFFVFLTISFRPIHKTTDSCSAPRAFPLPP